MSIFVCLAEPGQVVLGADSRVMRADFAAVDSDSSPKIFEVAPGTFIAPTGWHMMCEFQPERARELARELGTSDICHLADALDNASRPALENLVSQLSRVRDLAPRIADALCGAAPLHIALIAGRSGGRLGMVCYTYVIESGRIQARRKEYFVDDRRDDRYIKASAWQYVQHLGQDRATGNDDAVAVVKRYLEAGRNATWFIGGPDQIVRISDEAGVEWISRPPVQDAVGALAANTAVFDGDTVFAHDSVGPRVGINATGIDIYSSDATDTPFVSASTSGVLVSAGASAKPFVNIGTNGVLTVSSGVGSSAVTVNGTAITVQGSGLSNVFVDGYTVQINSGGTPRVVAQSSDITIYGAGTATAKFDATGIVFDTGVGPKASITGTALTIDSGGTPKVEVNSSAVVVTGASNTSLSLGSAGVSISGAGHPVSITSTGAVFGRQVVVQPADGNGASVWLQASTANAVVTADCGGGGHVLRMDATNGRFSVDGVGGTVGPVTVHFRDVNNTPWALTVRGGISILAPEA